MRRVASIAVLLVAASASAQSVDYFPDRVLGPPNVHAFAERWYSRHLAAMGEPSLWAMRGQGRRAIRFLRLPTWGQPVAIRVERGPAPATITRRTLTGQGGYEPGQLASETTRPLRDEDLRAIEAALRDARLFEQPATSELGLDGTQWILEVVDGDRYHVVDRWTADGTPDDPALARVSTLLERLASP